jgi:hypothetical protein
MKTRTKNRKYDGSRYYHHKKAILLFFIEESEKTITFPAI